jgi:hypothetical protein
MFYRFNGKITFLKIGKNIKLAFMISNFKISKKSLPKSSSIILSKIVLEYVFRNNL